jgi:hypothetical protein
VGRMPSNAHLPSSCPGCQESFYGVGYARDHLVSNRCGRVPERARQIDGRSQGTTRKREGRKR